MDRGQSTDSSLRARLQDLSDSVPEVEPPDPHGARGGRWSSIVATAAVIGITALLVTVVIPDQPGEGPSASATNSGSPAPASPTQTDPLPTPVASEPPLSGSIEVAWTVGSNAPGAVSAATFTGEVWVALGDGIAWWSSDALTWEAGAFGSVTKPPAGTSLEDWLVPQPVAISNLGGTWYAVARWPGAGGDAFLPLIFASANGRDWTNEPSSTRWGYYPTGLASNGSVLVATQYQFASGLGSTFTSGDGISWEEHFADGGPASMLDVVGSPDRVVAVGYREVDGGETPVVWWSDDGQTWSESGFASLPKRSIAWAVGRAPDGTYVLLATRIPDAAESCWTESLCTDTLTAWSSADGKTWVPTRFQDVDLPHDFHRDLSLVSTESGLVAFATTPDGIAAWGSVNGIDWSALAIPDIMKAASLTSTATDGETILLFGSSTNGDLFVRGVASLKAP